MQIIHWCAYYLLTVQIIQRQWRLFIDREDHLLTVQIIHWQCRSFIDTAAHHWQCRSFTDGADYTVTVQTVRVTVSLIRWRCRSPCNDKTKQRWIYRQWSSVYQLSESFQEKPAFASDPVLFSNRTMGLLAELLLSKPGTENKHVLWNSTEKRSFYWCVRELYRISCANNQIVSVWKERRH